MATQSLYRRYRPRRFAELKGQEHIVRALRTSVAEGREGQAYLFSGPRGTGKTTSARILAKVLNCQNPTDGEPCCECESCLAVEQGTSYDVHELDAASNNGVDSMRDLIEKASLGTPGRHKVYILDEVHMLSKGAEAALLKTLEEPPPHVVFVLATTDPQKMSDTIRSRTQHLQFHLLGADTLQDHVRWVASDAGLTVTDDAIAQVIAQGAGSARDALSALELVSNTGGDATESLPLDEFVEAMVDEEPGRALTMVAQAVSRGRDPRTVTEELIGFFRNAFLSLMAPDLVQLPSQRLDALTDLARRAGAPALVRGIELMGEALTEMRQAPDPRVLLDVAAVQLTSPQASNDVAGLTARLAKLEQRVANGVPAAAPACAPAAAAAPVDEAPVDEATGKRALGSRVGAARPASTPAEAPEPSTAVAPETPEAVEPAAEQPAPPQPAAAEPASAPPAETVPAEPVPAAAAPAAAPASGGAVSESDWSTIRAGFRGMTRAVLAPAEFVASAPGSLTIGLPNEPHRQKCENLTTDVEAAIAAHLGSPVALTCVVQGGGPAGGGGDDGAGGGSPAGGGGSGRTQSIAPADQVEASSPVDGPGPAMSGALAHDVSEAAPLAEPDVHLSVVPVDNEPAITDHVNNEPAIVEEPDGDVTAPVERPEVAAVDGRAIAEQARTQGPGPDPDAGLATIDEMLPTDEEVDLDDLVDAPPEAVRTPLDRLAEAFPGSELIDDTY